MSQEPILTYVLEVSCHDDCAEVPDKAKMVFNKETIDTINKSIRVLEELDACSIQFYDGAEALYEIDYDSEEETLIDKTDDYRVDFLEMIVTQYEVSWKGIIKHDTSYWNIESIPLNELMENWKVVSTEEKDIPLLINNLEYDTSKKFLKERIKGEVNV